MNRTLLVTFSCIYQGILQYQEVQLLSKFSNSYSIEFTRRFTAKDYKYASILKHFWPFFPNKGQKCFRIDAYFVIEQCFLHHWNQHKKLSTRCLFQSIYSDSFSWHGKISTRYSKQTFGQDYLLKMKRPVLNKNMK